VGREPAAEISVGEHTDQASFAVDHADRAGLGLCHGQKSILDGLILAGHGVSLIASHDVADFVKEGTTDGTSWVALGEVLLPESAGGHHRDG
jgi:hypothetical protein